MRMQPVGRKDLHGSGLLQPFLYRDYSATNNIPFTGQFASFPLSFVLWDILSSGNMNLKMSRLHKETFPHIVTRAEVEVRQC